MACASPDLSADEARRTILEAQGLLRPRPRRAADERALLEAVERLRLLQIDSVNVLERAHYVPLFSRLGPYDRTALDRLAFERRALFEFWGHEASLLPVRLHPLLRWRMEARTPWGTVATLLRDAPDAADAVLRELTERGPLGTSDLSDKGGRAGPWWGWGRGKHLLEWLFATGRVTTSTRRRFERVYDRTERVLPPEVLAAPAPPPDEAKKALLLESAAALGVGTARDLADYFRIHKATAAGLVEALASEGRLRRVRVEGWRHPAYALPTFRVPRAAPAARALLSPFDPLVFERARTERVFGFRYRIEIYTPAAKRVHGYYVLPFLLDGRLAARVDLKADRARCRLLVPGAFLEPGPDRDATAAALATELRLLADWLGLERIVVGRRGDLRTELRAALAT
jgi:uncharacterized protein YcaQ